MKKQKKITYTPVPVDTSAVELDDDIKELMELLAKNNHDVWAQGRINEGWKYAPKRSDRKKTNPCLVEYGELPESEKEYDRNTAAETLKCILKLGFKIEKE